MALTVYVRMLQMNVHVCMYVCMFCSVQCIYINRLITRESLLCGTHGTYCVCTYVTNECSCMYVRMNVLCNVYTSIG